MVMETAGNRLSGIALHMGQFEAEDGDAYRVLEQPLGTSKHVRIVGIGAGASGLNVIRTLRLNLTNYELVIYEKNEDVGGTWFENRYPGCRCDVPSHNYQFSWRPKPDWTNFHAPAEEIEEYLCKLCDEEGMRDSIRTQHKVVAAAWNEPQGVWDLKVQNLETGAEFDDHANFLLDGSGILKYVTFHQAVVHLGKFVSLIVRQQQLEMARRPGS
jgi:cation diffusion facilitator CzcD-associated flavoprotein CzcO